MAYVPEDQMTRPLEEESHLGTRGRLPCVIVTLAEAEQIYNPLDSLLAKASSPHSQPHS